MNLVRKFLTPSDRSTGCENLLRQGIRLHMPHVAVSRAGSMFNECMCVCMCVCVCVCVCVHTTAN